MHFLMYTIMIPKILHVNILQLKAVDQQMKTSETPIYGQETKQANL